MIYVLDIALLSLLGNRNNKDKKEIIVYETSKNNICNVDGCNKKAVYKLSRSEIKFCKAHYLQLFTNCLWRIIRSELSENNPIRSLNLIYNGKQITLNVLVEEKSLKKLQRLLQNLGFRNITPDKEIVATVVRSQHNVMYADWIDEYLIAFSKTYNYYVITQQEWEEIKNRLLKKMLPKKLLEDEIM